MTAFTFELKSLDRHGRLHNLCDCLSPSEEAEKGDPCQSPE
jgi:hypothetical protein